MLQVWKTKENLTISGDLENPDNHHPYVREIGPICPFWAFPIVYSVFLRQNWKIFPLKSSVFSVAPEKDKCHVGAPKRPMFYICPRF